MESLSNSLKLSNTNINVRGEHFDEVNSFTYLGSNITKQGGTDNDINDRISKICKTSNIGLKTQM